ncbi:MAG TPA: iron export ABC transporter permease subunit FetB [Armatimonadota bacterium]|jgi:putative ABC transport system permease protein
MAKAARYVEIGWGDLGLACLLVVFTLLLSRRQKLGLERSLLVGSVRAFLQLLAVGYVLKAVFDLHQWYWTLLMLGVMTAVAVWTAAGRERKSYPRALPILAVAIGGGSFLALGFVVGAVIRPPDWYSPQYAVPIGGMIIGNAMTGAVLLLDRLRSEVSARRTQVEAALCLGATSRQAVAGPLRSAVRAAMTPSLSSMMIVGVVQLPGMMTGQILAGAAPEQAIRYQIVVVYMISTAVALTSILAAGLAYRQLFTDAHQLLDMP